jgi:hypothetical protein
MTNPSAPSVAELDELERLLKAAHPGPWAMALEFNIGASNGRRVCTLPGSISPEHDATRDLLLTMHAALPSLLAAARASQDATPWPISTDGPHKISDHRCWLARQLMDSRHDERTAIGIVACSPAITDYKRALAPPPQAGPNDLGPLVRDWQERALTSPRPVPIAGEETRGDVNAKGPPAIWLQPECCVGLERQWSEDGFEECGCKAPEPETKYIRADLIATPSLAPEEEDSLRLRAEVARPPVSPRECEPSGDETAWLIEETWSGYVHYVHRGYRCDLWASQERRNDDRRKLGIPPMTDVRLITKDVDEAMRFPTKEAADLWLAMQPKWMRGDQYQVREHMWPAPPSKDEPHLDNAGGAERSDASLLKSDVLEEVKRALTQANEHLKDFAYELAESGRIPASDRVSASAHLAARALSSLAGGV